MDDAPLLPSVMLALATVCALTLTPTVAIGACNMTLRGDLVPDRDPKRYQTTPQRMLFFTINEIIEETGQRMAKHFQSFSFESATMSFPIPFALDIDSPRDCPKDVELSVTGTDSPAFRYEYPLRGMKVFSPGDAREFQRVIVFAPTF